MSRIPFNTIRQKEGTAGVVTEINWSGHFEDSAYSASDLAHPESFASTWPVSKLCDPNWPT